MKLAVFGNNATCPEAGGACSCFLVEAAGKRILLDMGNASLTQLQKRLDLKELDLILLSHLHFDHFGDLFCAKYQMETRAAQGEELRAIPLLAPALPDWAAAELLPGGVFGLRTVTDGFSLACGGVRLTFTRVEHLVESYAVRLEAEGKTLVYSGDSGLCRGLAHAAAHADVFLCEATFPQARRAEEGHHLSAASAARIAAGAGVGRLLLTHYHTADASALLAEAKKQFPNTQLTRIGEVYEL